MLLIYKNLIINQFTDVSHYCSVDTMLNGTFSSSNEPFHVLINEQILG